MGMFAAVSNDTQHALAVMLEDEKFIDSYVSENKRLRQHSKPMVGCLFFSLVGSLHLVMKDFLNFYWFLCKACCHNVHFQLQI